MRFPASASTTLQAMAAGKRITGLQISLPRHLAAYYRLQGLGPQRAAGQLCIVKFDVVKRRTDDAKTPKAVAQTDRN